MMILRWLAPLCAGLVIIWTLLPLLRSDAWYVRIFEFPRVQIAIIGAVTLFCYLAFLGLRGPLDWLLVAGLAASMVFQLIRIAPYTPLYQKQVHTAGGPADDETLHLMVSNVLTTNRNADALLKLVRERKPDLLLTVETDRWWEERLDTLAADYPFSVKHPLDNLYGMHLYSRLELIDPELHFLVEDDKPSIQTQVRLRSGRVIDLHCLHPAPPSPTENPTSAERDGELLVVAESIDKPARSVIVMGDLNDVAWSETTRHFQNISGLLDPRIGRGTFNTFNARYPFARWPLDHVFCSPDFKLVEIARLPDIGSDHFPIAAVLHLDPAAVREHEKLKPDAEDREVAEEKIEKVDADREALS
ncbi:endonuclease/exonuclease/phosphatase family protein [Piscinibacter sakaiensis]|uniref:endonuclease/exonuclease/phosphatase family protein n=1 Tax=Piscinibacter sakaiensis TaxID=1547922 RepID=UPI003AAECB86